MFFYLVRLKSTLILPPHRIGPKIHMQTWGGGGGCDARPAQDTEIAKKVSDGKRSLSIIHRIVVYV